MIDHASLVGKLHDIHPPLWEGILPLALMMLFGILCGIAFAALLDLMRPKQKNIYARAKVDLIRSRYYPPAERLAIQARMLRDIAASLDSGAAFLRGDEWLYRLDSISQTSFFTRGPGRVFADELYKPVNSSTAEILDRELSLMLARFENVRN